MNENERLLVEANLQRRNAHKEHLAHTEAPYAPRGSHHVTNSRFSDYEVSKRSTRTLDAQHQQSASTQASCSHCSIPSSRAKGVSQPLADNNFRQSKRLAPQDYPHAIVDQQGIVHKDHPSFIRSCRHALDGLKLCLTTERNFKIMLVIALGLQVLCLITPWMNITLYLLVTLYSVIMLVLELINTAIETLVDLASPEYHPLAKRAKDISAGAVSFFAVASIHLAIIGFVLPLFNHLNQ